jgi:O-antigen ligase
MPEHLRALIAILCISTAVFFTIGSEARRFFPEKGDYERRRNVWFAITLVAFLAHNFWIFILLASIVLAATAANEKNKVSLVFFILLIVPPIRGEIPGFAGIRYLFEMDYLRLIALVILLPAFFSQTNREPLGKFWSQTPDKFLIGYLMLNVLLIFTVSTITGTGRTFFLFFIDFFLPYIIASRLVRDTKDVSGTMFSYVMGAAIMACIGFLEFSKRWLLYSSLDESYGMSWNYGGYLLRVESLRAMTTAGHAIAYGYAMAIAFCMLLGLKPQFRNQRLWWLLLCITVLGLISSYSRGPWAGAIAGLMVFFLSGPEKWKNFGRMIMLSAILIPVALLTPLGDKLLEPVTVESGNYDYRQRLLEISIDVMLANPLFGAFDYIYSPAMQELKQGQGIIDIVNTYVAIGLSSGLVGLFLFVGFFVSVGFRLWRAIEKPQIHNTAQLVLGRGLLATLTCILVTIFTVSSITIIPTLYFLVAGLIVGYAKTNLPDKVIGGERPT